MKFTSLMCFALMVYLVGCVAVFQGYVYERPKIKFEEGGSKFNSALDIEMRESQRRCGGHVKRLKLRYHSICDDEASLEEMYSQRAKNRPKGRRFEINKQLVPHNKNDKSVNYEDETDAAVLIQQINRLLSE